MRYLSAFPHLGMDLNVSDKICLSIQQLVNGRFLMSKYSNDGHKLNHEILSPCTKEMVRLNLASPARAKCLLTWAPEETTYPAFCGDGVIQGQRASAQNCENTSSF